MFGSFKPKEVNKSAEVLEGLAEHGNIVRKCLVIQGRCIMRDGARCVLISTALFGYKEQVISILWLRSRGL